MSAKIIKYFLIIFLFSFKVSAIDFDGKFIQGHFIIGKTDPNSKIKIDKKQIIKKVQKRKYKIQRIDGLEEKKVNPPEEVYERIKKENKLIAKARNIDTDLYYFKDGLIIPVEDAIITGVYGSQRILNGEPKWPHYGIDFAQKKGTPIKSMLNGVATLVDNDLYFTGGTLIFDHGHGISTLYMHLDETFVEKGDIVKP